MENNTQTLEAEIYKALKIHKADINDVGFCTICGSNVFGHREEEAKNIMALLQRVREEAFNKGIEIGVIKAQGEANQVLLSIKHDKTRRSKGKLATLGLLDLESRLNQYSPQPKATEQKGGEDGI